MPYSLTTYCEGFVRRFCFYLSAALLMLLTSHSQANTHRVTVKGLFAGSAVLEVNGKAHMLKEGASTPEGITLLRPLLDYMTFAPFVPYPWLLAKLSSQV